MNEMPIEAMGLVLFVWFVLFLGFLGFGFFILRIFGLRYHGADNYLQTFWIGWAYIIIVLQIWHIFFSIDWKAGVLITALSLGGILWKYKEVVLFAKEKIPRTFVFCAILIISAIVLTNRAILSPSNYDSGIYHLTSVRWNASYPIIPGLGNLHGRLAFNSSYFCYVALLEIIKYQSHHFANGLLLLLVFAQIFLSIAKLLKNNGVPKIYNIYMALWLIPITQAAFSGSGDVSSPSTDPPIFILGILLSGKLLSILENSNDDKKERGFDLFYLTVIAIIGITIKLSFIVLAVSSCMLAFAAYLFRLKKTKDNHHVFKKIFKRIILTAAIALLPWMVRSVILSGYLIYPSTLCSFNVDWRIPQASVVNNANYLKSWGRMPYAHWSEVLGNWDWLAPWIARALSNIAIVVPLALAAIGCFLVILRVMIKKANRRTEAVMWLFILPPLVSIMHWFFLVPEPRYLGANLWILGIGIFSLAINGLANSRKTFTLYVFLYAVFMAQFFLGGKVNFIETAVSEKSISEALQKLYFRNIVKREGSGTGFYKTPQQKLKTFETNSGLMLYVPEEGDQCWDVPLPCTPYPHPSYVLRKKGDMRHGFSVYPRDEQDPTVGMHR